MISKNQLIQYNTVLAITRALRSSSRENVYQELGLESVQQRWWFRKLCYFVQITKIKPPSICLIKSPPLGTHIEQEKISTTFPSSMLDMFFKNSFLPSTVIEWNNLDKCIRSSESFALFKKSILQLTRASPNSNFNCHNPIGIKLITSLKLDLSHPQDQKFKHNFLDCLNPFCCCGNDIETTVHYVLLCPIFSDERSIFSDERSIFLNKI